MKQGKKLWWLMVWHLSLVFTLMSCQSEPQPGEENVIVRVGEKTLTLDQLVDEIPQTVRDRISKEEIQDYIVRWINSQVLYQEAKRQGLDHRINLSRELERVERELLVSALIENEVTKKSKSVSAQQIEEFYEKNKESFKSEEDEVHVWHVYSQDESSADSLYRELRRRDDFDQVARQLAAANEYDDSWDLILAESQVPEAASRIFRTREGSVLSPIQLDDGYHVFKIVEQFRKGSYRGLDQVRDEIKYKIQAQQREERYRELLSELASNTRIETNFQMLETLPLDSLFTIKKKNVVNNGR